MWKTCANICGLLIDISQNLLPMISNFSASWSMGRSGKTLLLSHVAPHWGNESEIWMPTSKRGDGVSDFHKIHRKYRSTWKEPIPTFLFGIVELPPKQGGHDEMWWKTWRKKSGYHHAKKDLGKNAGCCIHVHESPSSMPSAGMCVCVQMRQQIEQPVKCQGNKLWSQTTNPHPTETTQRVTKARHAFGPLLHHPHLPWVPRPMVLHVSPPPS